MRERSALAIGNCNEDITNTDNKNIIASHQESRLRMCQDTVAQSHKLFVAFRIWNFWTISNFGWSELCCVFGWQWDDLFFAIQTSKMQSPWTKHHQTKVATLLHIFEKTECWSEVSRTNRQTVQRGFQRISPRVESSDHIFLTGAPVRLGLGEWSITTILNSYYHHHHHHHHHHSSSSSSSSSSMFQPPFPTEIAVRSSCSNSCGAGTAERQAGNSHRQKLRTEKIKLWELRS